nr:hypothetical protein [Tanacetum cinerariifolium]
VYTKSKKEHELHLKMNLELLKKEKCYVKPNKEESFRMCIDYRELSKIDLYLGCHQMRVHEDEIPKTAFRMRYRHFKLTVMSFRLTNATVVFMELMSRVYTKSKKEHELHLKMNLELLKKEKCYVKPNKVKAE